VVDQLATGLCVIAPDSSLQYVNKTLADWAGAAKADLTGRKCGEVFHWSTCGTDLCPLRRIGDGVDVVGPLPLGGGRFEKGCPGALTAWALRGEDGRISRVVEQISRVEPWNRSAFAHMDHTAMVLYDRDGVVLWAWASGLEARLGYSPTDLCGKHVADFLPPEMAATRLRLLREAVERNESVCDEYLAPTPKGRIWLEMTYIPVPQAGGQPPVVLAIGRDVTERKQAAQTLQRKDVALQELLGSIEDAKTQMSRQIQASLDRLISPALHEIQERLDEADRPLVEVVGGYLREICSPYATRLSQGLTNLTPHEMRIAGLIRSGMSSKQIANLEHISTATVNKHREHIRQKLGISGRHMNLASYLQSLSGEQAPPAPDQASPAEKRN